MDKSALHRFFLNECSHAERKEVIGWLSDPQNDFLVKMWMKENWDLISAADSKDEPDVEKIWSDLSAKLFNWDVNVSRQVKQEETNLQYANRSTPRTIEAPVKNIRTNKTLWMAAASIIITLGLFAYGFRDSILNVRYQTDFGQVTEFNLPDGSHVVLNANSSLLVPRWGFDNGDRIVQLQGEAAFEVKHTVNHQKFLVNTNSNLNVEVLGTEFLVYSRNETNKVVLKQGSVKVQFHDGQRQPVLMKPGDVVTADKAGSLSVKHEQPVNNFIPWKDHRFIFESTTLNEVISHITEFFGDTIIIDGESIGDKTITGSFSATSARELLAIIAEIYNLEINQTKEKIILRDKNSVLKTQDTLNGQ